MSRKVSREEELLGSESEDITFDTQLNLEFEYKDYILGFTSSSSEALRKKAKQLKLKTKNVEFVRVRDKIAFVLGVMNLGITAFLTGGYPLLAPLWYTFKALTLITTRFFLYRRNKWHFFLADFCYFANLLLLAYVWFFPSNAKLFHVCFAFATGPLSWAVVLWSNSMVFHSIDKMTSVFIHVSPPLLVWVMRWKQRDPIFAITECADCTPSFFDLTLFPLVPYLLWQLLYAFFIEYMSREKIKSGYVTSLTYLMGTESLVKKIVRKSKLPNSFAPIIFMTMQFIYTLLSLLPMTLLWDSFALHTAYLLVIIVVCTWNGACYYTEYFAARYLQNLEKMRAKFEQNSR